MSDPKCDNPNCPYVFRRQEDSGTQAILDAIGDVRNRLGSIETTLRTTTNLVATHETEINNIKTDHKSKIERKWLLVSAVIGASLSILAGMFKGNH